MTTRRIFLLFGCWSSLMACQQEKLPYYGEPELVKKVVDGREVEEKDHPVIPPFRFINQDGKSVTERDVTGRIYVADFFFVICPIMSRNLKDVYDAFKGDSDVRILSHTIDWCASPTRPRYARRAETVCHRPRRAG